MAKIETPQEAAELLLSVEKLVELLKMIFRYS